MLPFIKAIVDAIENKTGNPENDIIEICVEAQKMNYSKEEIEKILKLLRDR